MGKKVFERVRERRAAPLFKKEHPFGAKIWDKVMILRLSNEGLHPSLGNNTPSGLRNLCLKM